MIDKLGIAAAIVFFLLITGCGLVISFMNRLKGDLTPEELMVGKRDIGMIIGIFTMTATWVGGGYLSGTAEQIFNNNSGLLWVQAPIGYASSLFIAGFFFAKKFREKKFLTLMDPFQAIYGSSISSLLTLPAIMGEMLWSSAVLLVLASSLKIITGMSQTISVIASALTTVAFTVFGGIYAVAYTDALQLVIMTIGLVIAAPYAMNNGNKLPNAQLKEIDYIGVVDKSSAVKFVDLYITYIFGGLPWQALFQRVLSSKSPRIASYVSSISAIICVVLSIPSIFIGIAAKNTDWSYFNFTFNENKTNLTKMIPADVLPLSIAYLTPPAVKFIGIGAIVAATISSISSSFLAAGSLVTQNIYVGLIRKKAKRLEIRIAQIAFTLVIALVVSTVSMFSKSVYVLFGLCSDFIYILIFPQLVLLVYTDFTNSYGVLCGYFTAFVVRLASDWDIKNIFSDNHVYPVFPYKTVSMLTNLVITVSVSYLTRYMIVNKGKKWDILCFYKQDKPKSFKELKTDES